MTRAGWMNYYICIIDLVSNEDNWTNNTPAQSSVVLRPRSFQRLIPLELASRRRRRFARSRAIPCRAFH